MNLFILILLYLYLILCTISDLKTKTINIFLSAIYFSFGIIWQLFFINTPGTIIISNLFTGIFLMLISFFTKGAIGIGDAIIFIIISLYTASTCTLEILFYSLLLASCFSLILLLKNFSKKHTIPFAPFILSGFTIHLILQFF